MRVGSLFSGIGGADLGLEAAGFETVWFVEKDKFCQKVLRKNWPNVPIYGDINEIDFSKLSEIEVLVGGFPCQPFSLAGKRSGEEDDRYLWPKMFDVVKALRPIWVICENVSGFVSMGLEQTLSDLEAEAYETQSFLIPACAFGAEHRRDRLFVVAYSYSQFSKKQCESVTVQKKRNTVRRNSRRLAESRVDRTTDGVPYRVDRIRSLGNAIVPQVIEEIGRNIMKAERAWRKS